MFLFVFCLPVPKKKPVEEAFVCDAAEDYERPLLVDFYLPRTAKRKSKEKSFSVTANGQWPSNPYTVNTHNKITIRSQSDVSVGDLNWTCCHEMLTFAYCLSLIQ